MATEHTPRPGARWETTLARVERVVEDGQPEPRPNRAARRAARSQPIRIDTAVRPWRQVEPDLLAGLDFGPTAAAFAARVDRALAAPNPTFTPKEPTP